MWCAVSNRSFAGAPVVLRRVKPGKYFGCVVAEVITPGGAKLAEALLNAGLARPWMRGSEGDGAGSKPKKPSQPKEGGGEVKNILHEKQI